VSDALHGHGVEIGRRAESQPRQQRELVGGVASADVQCRVGFGIAEPLRVLENVVEVPPGGFHLRQDVIAGAVQNAAHGDHAVGDQALAQRLDDGDAAATAASNLSARFFSSASAASLAP